MKYGKHLEFHLTPEWRKQHIDYDRLKQIIFKLQTECSTEFNPAERDEYLQCKDSEFFEVADVELMKVCD